MDDFGGPPGAPRIPEFKGKVVPKRRRPRRSLSRNSNLEGGGMVGVAVSGTAAFWPHARGEGQRGVQALIEVRTS